MAGTSEVGMSIIDDLIVQQYNVTFTWWQGDSRAEELINKYGNQVKAIQLDLTCEESVIKFCQNLEGTHINVTIYCAGINPTVLCDELDDNTVKKTSWLNFLSATLIFNTIAKNMKPYKEAETKLIYISSVASQKVSIGNNLYGATKMAMERYMSSMALEMARFNMRTLCLSPGYIKTRMLDEYCREKGVTLRDIEKNIPMRKMLIPEDIVNTINAFINNRIITTGTTLILGNGERFI
ncbi:SDR family oxidoreductase [Photorhabdus laumondii]|uniref:SDR family oxidoreductase n=1 Tax=Photorhabdus laumondii TaxID=2218628 RepID=UPI00331539BA